MYSPKARRRCSRSWASTSSSKACLYLKRLADVDQAVLKKVIAASVAEVRRRYP